MKGIKLLLGLYLLAIVSLNAQSDSVLARVSQPRFLLKLGKNSLKQNDPKTAVTILEAYLKKSVKNNNEAFMYLGTAYMQLRNYDMAQKNFLRAYRAGKVNNSQKYKMSEALYYHALMQKSNGLYDSARVNFVAFKKEYKGKNKLLKKRAVKEITFCDSVHKLLAEEKKITVLRLDTGINKVNAEAAPIALDNLTMLFTSLRTEGEVIVSEEDTGVVPKRKIYYATKKKGKWKFVGEYANLNDEDFNTGNACLSPDGKRLYFTRCKPNYANKMICAIYVSERKGNEWLEPVKLPKSINNPKYTSTMPAVTTNQVKGGDIIYYVSNKNGKGGMDIWYTAYNTKTKTYREPKNAGNKINTVQNEISPFFDNETQSLYFSSDGHGGLGGYDIFKATGDGKRWSDINNIGRPLNGGADDVYFTISPNRREGLFVSNRKGGNALKNATCCDDIYAYYDNEYVNLSLKGNVGHLIDPFEPIKEATIELFIKNPQTNEKFLVKTTTTNSNGDYTLSLEPGHNYMVVVKKDNFLGTNGDLNTQGIVEDKIVNMNLRLKERPKNEIRIPNLQYEFDKTDILEASKHILDTTVLELMQLNPELVVEIQSHTDSKGNEKYNLKLSQKRAESVVSYLISKGIDRKRLRAIGFGESKSIAPNELPNGADNPEGRAKNRRTDFKIIGVVNAQIINEAD